MDEIRKKKQLQHAYPRITTMEIRIEIKGKKERKIFCFMIIKPWILNGVFVMSSKD